MGNETDSNLVDLNRYRMRRATQTASCDSCEQQYRGIPMVAILAIAGLNPDLTCNVSASTNAKYLRALETEDERTAQLMADASFGAQLPGSEVEYEQCLVDARRMLIDPEYRRLFE